MATGTRMRGNQGLYLTLKVGAGAAEDKSGDVKKWELTPEDGEDSDVTFEEALAGATAQWVLKLTSIISHTAGSLWQFLWTNPGVDVEFVLGPYGNAAPSVDKPHFTGTWTGARKPGLQNEARTTKEGSEFEVELNLVDEPELVTGA